MSDEEDLCVDEPSVKVAHKSINLNTSDGEDICVDGPLVKAAHKTINVIMINEAHLCVDEPLVKAAHKSINLNTSDGEDICVDGPLVKAAHKAINFNVSDEEDLCVDEPSVKTGPKVKCNENDDEDLHMHVRDLDKNSLSCAKRKLSSFLAKDSAKELAEMETAGECVADISVKRRRTNITDGEKPRESNCHLRDGTEGCTQECSDNKDDCKNYLKLLPDENMNKACGDNFLSIPGSSKICEMRHPLTKKPLKNWSKSNKLLSSSSKKAMKDIEDGQSVKREQGKATFAQPALSYNEDEIYYPYVTGEAPSLGVAASSQGEFSSLMESSCHSAFAPAKVFSFAELDHLIKNILKVFKGLSFLDWTIGTLAMKIEDFKGLD
ncbi:uncharacterized protein [Macrobrachium rosenbergii]|uniref:uncharacterized protein n=1 Tax=Macrobrachium rosenbergii TaxID=79674 RepID=UPI0034D56DFA